MRSLIKNLLFVFIFCAFAGAQDLAGSADVKDLNNLHLKTDGLQNSIRQLEEREDELVAELSEIGKKDRAEAERLKAEVVRLFPCCPLAGEDREMFGMASGYTFRTEKTGDGYFAVTLFFEAERFRFSKETGNHGFIMNIGKIPLENVSEKLPQFAALAGYRPPFETEEIKPEFVADGFTFHPTAPVKAGDTYLLRAVSYAADGNIDSLYALKVERRDADGSIIVFFKKLKDFPLPKLSNEPKYERSDIYNAGMVIKINGILRERGIGDVRFEFVDWNLIIKGTVPKGKAAEVVELVTNLNPSYKVKSELVEK